MKNSQRGSTSLRGETRRMEVRRMRGRLSLREDAPLRERLLAIKTFLSEHAGYPARILCEAAGVDQGTYRYFIKTGGTGDNGYQARRIDAARVIRELIEGSEHDVSIAEATAILKRRGIQCCKTTVSDIFQELGIATGGNTVNSLSRFLDMIAKRGEA